MTTDSFYIHSAATARQIDASAIHDLHIPSLILMEHAAIECVRIIQNHISHSDIVCLLCGPGNNGGDGFAIARLLFEQGYTVRCVCVPKESMSQDELVQFQMIESLKIPYTHSLEQGIEWMKQSSVLVDALFGNGLSRNVEGWYKSCIDACNQMDAYVFSIDVPSGLDATSGKVLGVCVQADCTIGLDCYKLGHWLQDGPAYCGKKYCVHIGIPDFLHEQVQDSIRLLQDDLVRSMFPKRSVHSHKGSFGKALMIGGSFSMPGAISMAAKACYRSGVGTLTLLIPDCIANLLACKMDVAMFLRASSDHGVFSINVLDDLKESLLRFTHVSIGNGMQKNKTTEAMLDVVLHSSLPVIVDADAIYYAGKHVEWLDREYPTILTPHIKEMSDLTGVSIDEILKNPFSCVKDFCQKHENCVLVLKSHLTYIGYGSSIYVLDSANDALAKGGSGDLLCGIITGLYGQCHDALKACVCGVYLHSLAAKTSLDGAVFQPDDLLDHLDGAFKKLR